MDRLIRPFRLKQDIWCIHRNPALNATKHRIPHYHLMVVKMTGRFLWFGDLLSSHDLFIFFSTKYPTNLFYSTECTPKKRGWWWTMRGAAITYSFVFVIDNSHLSWFAWWIHIFGVVSLAVRSFFTHVPELGGFKSDWYCICLGWNLNSQLRTIVPAIWQH